MKTIVIVGAGFSGTVMALEFIRNQTSHKIILIEKGDLARGFAYADIDDALVLNVRCDNMGAFADQPDGFYQWLLKKNIPTTPDALMPRKIFGDYLQELLKTSSSKVEIIHDEVIDINEQNKTLKLAHQPELKFDQLILATGVDVAPPDLKKITPSNEEITILGTSLSMVDAVLYLHKINYPGKIKAYSRHGRLPQPHDFSPKEKIAFDFSQNKSLRFVFQMVREKLEGHDWIAVIDGIRAHSHDLFTAWSLREKKQFIRHVKPLWDIHRHRMGKEQRMTLEQMMKENRLEIHALGYHKSFTGDKIIDCRGTSFGKNIFIKNLIDKKIIRKDDLNIGIECDKVGKVNDWLYLIGPALRGQLWEATAVPDIRKQAKSLASLLA